MFGWGTRWFRIDSLVAELLERMSPPPSSASVASLVHFTQPQTLCGHLAKVLRLLHAQLWLRRHPALSTSLPTLTTIGTPSSTPTALLCLLTAQQPPSPSRPTPLELVGALVTSAAAACASPSSAPCGERSERPPFFTCDSQFGVYQHEHISFVKKKSAHGWCRIVRSFPPTLCARESARQQ